MLPLDLRFAPWGLDGSIGPGGGGPGNGGGCQLPTEDFRPDLPEDHPCEVSTACSWTPRGSFVPRGWNDEDLWNTTFFDDPEWVRRVFDPAWVRQMREAYPWMSEDQAWCEVARCYVSFFSFNPFITRFEEAEALDLRDELCAAWESLQDRPDFSSGGCSGGGGDYQVSTNLDGNALFRMGTAAMGGPLAAPVLLTHNSAGASQASAFGNGWTTNWSSRITSGATITTLTTGNATELGYTGSPPTGGLYTAPDGAIASLKKTSTGWEEIYPGVGSRVYNTSGQLVRISTPTASWTLTYSAGLVSKITDAAGGLTTFSYTSGKLNKITDPASRDTLFSVDAQGDLVKITSPELCITSLSYDGSHRLTKWTPPSGAVTTYSYDASNRLTGIKEPGPSAPVTTITYASNQFTIKDPRGNDTVYKTFADGSLRSLQQPDGGITSYSWQNKWPRTVQTPAGLVYTFSYQTLSSDSSLRRLESVQVPAGGVTNYQLDANDHLEAWIAADGSRSTLTWDGDRVRSYQNPRGYRTT